MRPQPRVDARQVERVAALREQAQGLVFVELSEADGAVSAVNESFACLIPENRDRIDVGLIETDGADVPDRVVQLHPSFFVKESEFLASVEQDRRISRVSAIRLPRIAPFE